jgi:cytochrome c biogenesis protein CcmG/thiol:disulfide interchange protein DsbE
VLALAACGGDDEVVGGAADLPGPVPAGVEFAAAPGSALPAPPFAGELLDGEPVTGEELWADRPWLFVFTASYCDRCREIHRAAAEAVDGFDGAAGLLGILGEDDVNGGAEYAEELDLGHPVATADERVWLNYAAREPGLVVLVAKGGKVVRGWPTGVTADELRAALDELIVQ